MAGQAAKKAERAKEKASNLYYPIIFATNVLFVLCRVPTRLSAAALCRLCRSGCRTWGSSGKHLQHHLSTTVLYNRKTFGRWQAFLLVATSLAYYICYHGLISAAMNGVPGGVYFDVLCVCVAGQFVTIFSDFYGMLVFMLVPGYYMSLAIYWIIKKLGEWMRSQQLENLNDGLSEKDAKRQAKKERKAAKRPQIRMR